MEKDEDQAAELDLPSGHRRRPVRNCVRKVRASTTSSQTGGEDCGRKVKAVLSEPPSSDFTIQQKSRKRKKVHFEDDPNYSEVENEDEFSQHHRKVPGYRCSPHLIPELMEKLTDKQRGWVKNIQWHSLQDMIDSRMQKSLTMWLVDRVNTSNGTLEVCGTPIDIKKAIVRILKLPCGHIKVPPPLNGRSKAKIRKGDSSNSDQKHSDNGRGKTAKDATKDLLKENDNEAEFCRSFVMLVLCTYIAPTTSLNINRNYYPSLMDVTKISLMDWCGFIVDYLIQGIEEFRSSSKSHVQVPGCVHILPLVYIDALINMKALVLPEALSLPEGEPRIHFIGTDHLSYLASVDVKSRTKDSVEYGLLEESWRASTGVPPSSGQEFAGHMCGLDNSVPPTCGNENNGEISAADFMRSLFDEIKESRQQIFQDFQIKIVESDRKIFSEFERKFSQRFTVSPKARPVEENVMPPASPAPAKAGQCTTSNVPEEQEMMDNSHISSSEYALRTTESSEDKHTSTPPTLPDSDDVVGHQTIPPASMVQNANLKPTPESSEPDTMDSVQIDLISTTFQPQKMDGHLPNVTPSMDKQISLDESMSSLNLDGSKIISAGCSDEFADVVSIGAAAAHEASCNQQSDGEPSYHGFPNLAVPAKYDHSPALPSKIVSATIPSIISDSSNLHPSPSPLFNSAGPSPAAPSLEPAIKGPALFDTSPATPSILAAMSELFAKHISRNVCTSSEVKTSSHTSNLADTMLHVADGKVSCTAEKSGELDASLHKKTTTEAAVSVSPVLPDSVQSISGLLTQCSHSPGVLASDCDDETDSDDVSRDGSASEEDMHCLSIPDCTPTPPSYTYDTQEFIDIPDDPVTPAPNDIIHIPPLQIELQDGYRFKFGGSITLGTCKMFDKLKQLEKNNPLVVAISDAKFVLSKDAKNTYQQHVLDSKARVSSRHRNIDDQNRRRTKIQIKRFHITKGEFVDALKPNGEVCQVLMGLCSVAIMCDWESRTKIILDQQMISQLMKSSPECDQKAIAAKLKKLPLDEIEEIYLPLLNNSHWFLAVVNFVTEIVEFYDSLLVVKEGEHPHKDFWNNLCGNLQEAYSIAKKRSVFIEYFGCTYPGKRIQSTNHDCGYHVIQQLECLNSEDLVGHSKKSMTAFRKYLCHILVYHRFNDLNPLRPHLREEEP